MTVRMCSYAIIIHSLFLLLFFFFLIFFFFFINLILYTLLFNHTMTDKTRGQRKKGKERGEESQQKGGRVEKGREREKKRRMGGG